MVGQSVTERDERECAGRESETKRDRMCVEIEWPEVSDIERDRDKVVGESVMQIDEGVGEYTVL